MTSSVFAVVYIISFAPESLKTDVSNDKRGLKIHSFGQNSGFGWPYQEIGKVYKSDLPVIYVKFNKV